MCWSGGCEVDHLEPAVKGCRGVQSQRCDIVVRLEPNRAFRTMLLPCHVSAQCAEHGTTENIAIVVTIVENASESDIRCERPR